MTAFSLFLSPATYVMVAQATLAQVPQIAFVLQVRAVGAAIGSGIALRARTRDGNVDAWRTTTAWSDLGLLVGGSIGVVLGL